MSDPRRELLEAYAAAWNAHDIEAIMAMMTRDCVFLAGGGPDAWGSRVEGAVAVRERFIEVWNCFPDASWNNARHAVCGERGLSEWVFTGTSPEGRRIEIHGCDLFTFHDDLIAIKDTYLKSRE